VIFVGIVGNGADKFSECGKARVIEIITALLSRKDVVLVSGHSPMGGVDIWAEEVANQLGVQPVLFVPTVHAWGAKGGYKERNIAIAETSDELHVIVADAYPEGYSGMRFDACYHCLASDHIKSGGCWTGKEFERVHHQPRVTHIVCNQPRVGWCGNDE
jgi:hypothetical protein